MPDILKDTVYIWSAPKSGEEYFERKQSFTPPNVIIISRFTTAQINPPPIMHHSSGASNPFLKFARP